MTPEHWVAAFLLVGLVAVMVNVAATEEDERD